MSQKWASCSLSWIYTPAEVWDSPTQRSPVSGDLFLHPPASCSLSVRVTQQHLCCHLLPCLLPQTQIWVIFPKGICGSAGWNHSCSSGLRLHGWLRPYIGGLAAILTPEHTQGQTTSLYKAGTLASTLWSELRSPPSAAPNVVATVGPSGPSPCCDGGQVCPLMGREQMTWQNEIGTTWHLTYFQISKKQIIQLHARRSQTSLKFK